MRLRLIPGWRRELTRLWSMRVAYFWTVVGALATLWVGLAGKHPGLAFPLRRVGRDLLVWRRSHP
jgi:hypothetical protein